MVVRGFFAVQNTLFPAVYGTLAVVLSLPLFYFGMQHMGARGVALAVSLAAILQVLMLYSIWNKKSRNTRYPAVAKFYVKVIFISLLMGIALEWFRQTVLSGINAMTLPGSFLVSIIMGTLFSALFIGAGYFLGISEISGLVRRIRNKLFQTSP